jgi:hypothetical protein
MDFKKLFSVLILISSLSLTGCINIVEQHIDNNTYNNTTSPITSVPVTPTNDTHNDTPIVNPNIFEPCDFYVETSQSQLDDVKKDITVGIGGNDFSIFTVPVKVSGGHILKNQFILRFETGKDLPCPSGNLFFETQYSMKYEGVDVLTKRNGVWFANWSEGTPLGVGRTWNYKGEFFIPAPENPLFNIYYEINPNLGSVFNSVGDIITWTITFHNGDSSWFKSYTVNILCIKSTV